MHDLYIYKKYSNMLRQWALYIELTYTALESNFYNANSFFL